MAYLHGDCGSFDPATGRGSNWVDLTEDQRAVLAAELALPAYADPDAASRIARLVARERTGPTERAVPVTRVTRAELVAEVGPAAFGRLRHVIGAGGPAGEAAGDLLEFIKLSDTMNPCSPVFAGAVDAMVAVGAFEAEDAARIKALAERVEIIPEHERPLGPPRLEAIGLGDLALTEADLTDLENA